MTLKPYPKYRASGVEWLGDVPEGWSVAPLKRIVAMTNQKIQARDNAGGYVGMENIDSWTGKYVESTAPLEAEGLSNGFDAGDVLFGKLRPYLAKAWLSDRAGVCSSELLVLRPRKIVAQFLLHQVLNKDFITLVDGSTYGSKMPRASWDFIGNIELPLPSKNEQTNIAAFLDRETAKIDNLIAKQEAMIGLLKEKRQAVISHAVTKGLDPSVPMKPSGVEWLGDVPEHWIVMTLTRVTTSKCDGPFGSGLKSDHYTGSGARVVRLQNIKAAHFHGDVAAYIDLKYFEDDLSRHDVQEGDLLIAGLGDDKNLVGRACVAPLGIAPALVKADCFRFRLNLDLAVPSYIAFQLCCSASVDAGTLATGSTRSRIPLSTMASRVVVLPPQEEQTKIVAYIDAKSAKFFALIAKAQQAIALQKEHRTALISAAVTGKIDVRNEVAERKAA